MLSHAELERAHTNFLEPPLSASVSSLAQTSATHKFTQISAALNDTIYVLAS